MIRLSHVLQQRRGAGMFVAWTDTARPRSRERNSGGFAICGKAEVLLTAEQERVLAERIANGDREARNELVQANLRLVAHIARGYDGRGIDPEDLVSEGYVGLINAAERFDPRFNTRFSTYASYWIKEAIQSALNNTTAMIRLPIHVVTLLNKWRRATGALERALGREPRFDEVANAMSLSEGQRRIVEKALCTRYRSDSGEMPIDVAVPPEEPLADWENAEDRDELRHRLERLSPRERTVITLRYGLAGGKPMTLKETGRELGITREWVRKIEIRALATLSYPSD
jgi:RNA polymerase primary sigma factor